MNKSPVKATAITMVNIQIVDFFILSEQVINLYYVNNRNLLKFRDWCFMILTRIERYRLTFKCKINIKFLQSKKISGYFPETKPEKFSRWAWWRWRGIDYVARKSEKYIVDK